MTFKVDYDGIGEMLCSPLMQAEMLRRIDKAKAAAVADAPYDANDRDGVHYKDSFETSVGIQSRRTRRAVGTLTNTDGTTAFLTEHGSRNNPAHHTMVRALDAARD